MPQLYSEVGLRFLYPENWSLDNREAGSQPKSVTVIAPGGAFWSVDVHPFSVDPRELLLGMLDAMRAEYDDLEGTPATEAIGGEPAAGIDLSFSCLDFVITAQLRCFRHGHATYGLTYQAEDREFEKFRLVFRAISESLFRKLEEVET